MITTNYAADRTVLLVIDPYDNFEKQRAHP
jgi:hypothetical protein